MENSLYCQNFPHVVPKFPVFALSGKTDDQIPRFPSAVATLLVHLLKFDGYSLFEEGSHFFHEDMLINVLDGHTATVLALFGRHLKNKTFSLLFKAKNGRTGKLHNVLHVNRI